MPLPGLRARLAAVDEAALQGRPEWGLYHNRRERLESNAQLRVCRSELWEVNHGVNGWLGSVLATVGGLPVGTDVDRTRVERLWRDVPRLVDTEIANLREGLRQGYTAPRPLVERVLQQADLLLADSVTASPPFYGPARRDTTAAFRAALAPLITTQVDPALARYRDFLRTEYLSQARTAPGLAAIPEGEACYRAMIRRQTSLALTPEQVRVRLEAMHAEQGACYAALLRERFNRTDLQESLMEMRADLANRFRSREEAIAAAEAALARAIREAPRAFVSVPNAQPVVEPMEPAQEAVGQASYFARSSHDGSVPPRWVFNVASALAPGGRLRTESTAYHEGWPGHALQLELTNEQVRAGGAALPPVAARLGNSGFVEGWALYAELDVAPELGLYGDTALVYGQALQWYTQSVLGVETELHEGTLTRDSAVARISRGLGVPPQRAGELADRVISTPGQAFSYDLGRDEIRRLRREAEAALEARFDLRRFHEVVLENGSVPLPVLRRQVERWIAEGR